MILFDTSVWIDHLSSKPLTLSPYLLSETVCLHPFITGEIAMGSLRNRAEILSFLALMPQSVRASDSEVLEMVARQHLFARGLGYIDAHLLTATQLTPDALFITRDKRLAAVADELGIGMHWDRFIGAQ